MNDFMEIRHGQNCLVEAWNGANGGAQLQVLLEELETGLSHKIENQFSRYRGERDLQSFLISVSEHGNSRDSEDKYGRLSMWRAYGGNTNVAFVFKNKPFIMGPEDLNAWSSPVLYQDADGFKDEFLTMVKGLEDSFEFLKTIDVREVEEWLVWAFHFATISTKHPGFAEEREWRIIHSPSMYPSSRIDYSIETIRGVPQKVYKLPLKNVSNEGLTGATLPELIEKIIVGPTENPCQIREALALKLEEKGVSNAWEKVIISDIPLRK